MWSPRSYLSLRSLVRRLDLGLSVVYVGAVVLSLEQNMGPYQRALLTPTLLTRSKGLTLSLPRLCVMVPHGCDLTII